MVEKQHLKNTKLEIAYDDFSDVLYISFGKPEAAISVEISESELVRVNPFTDEIVGVTVLDFRERCVRPSMGIEDSARDILPNILHRFEEEKRKASKESMREM
jgi:uncharacterized protein YuzE